MGTILTGGLALKGGEYVISEGVLSAPVIAVGWVLVSAVLFLASLVHVPLRLWGMASLS